MKKKLVVLGLLLVMTAGATLVFAEPGPGPGPGRRWQEGFGPGMNPPLSPEQKAKFQELRRQFAAENAQLIGAIVTKRMELRTLWSDPKAEPKAIEGKEKELRDLQNQVREKGLQFRLEARKSLTPEQISQFGHGSGMGRGMMSGRSGMMGRGRGMGMGMMDREMGGPGMGPGMGGAGPCYGWQ